AAISRRGDRGSELGRRLLPLLLHLAARAPAPRVRHAREPRAVTRPRIRGRPRLRADHGPAGVADERPRQGLGPPDRRPRPPLRPGAVHPPRAWARPPPADGSPAPREAARCAPRDGPGDGPPRQLADLGPTKSGPARRGSSRSAARPVLPGDDAGG